MLANLVSKCAQLLKMADGDDKSSRKNSRKTLWVAGGEGGVVDPFLEYIKVHVRRSMVLLYLLK